MLEQTENPVQQLSGVVENLVFHNDSNGFSVLEINVEGEIITCVGTISEAAPGEDVLLTGQWDTHTVFGRQFKFSSCTRSMPDTTAKVYRYLASGAVKGIGPKTAMRIIEQFGDKTVEILESFPDKLASVKGISKQRAIDISNSFNQQYAMRKVMIELETYGITASECARIFKYFGVEAISVIRENPYILCGTVQGFSFERAQKLSEDMHLTPEPKYRNRAGLLYIIKHNLYANGHTCIPREKLFLPAENLLQISQEEVSQTIDDLLEIRKLVESEFNGSVYIFLPEIFQAERNIAEKMEMLLRFRGASIRTVTADIEAVEQQNGILYEEKQKEAICAALEKGILILTGGPGTGKTTAVRGIISVFERNHIDVALCAPTGMASNRLSEVTGREAKTIHRLLEVEWDDSETPVFRKNTENPLSCGALIVDEMSMVDVELFSSLLDALPIGCRLILVGDADQLPSVGPGNVLGDLIGSGRIPVVSLTEIFRQAQKSLIVMNAHRIIEGADPDLHSNNSDFFFLKRSSAQDVSKTVSDLIVRRLPEAYGFSPIDDIQVLSPSKKGDCGTVNLNMRLQSVLNPPALEKSEITTFGGRIFREGDRVMQNRNNYDIEWTRGAEVGAGVFNGDIGIIEKINFAAGVIRIRFADKIAEYPVDHLSELEHAYAITVHKSQGSEYPVVIVPLIDTPSQLMYRNLLYTAVTRAKKMLIAVGSEEKLLRMTQNNKINKRYSALKNFLV